MAPNTPSGIALTAAQSLQNVVRGARVPDQARRDTAVRAPEKAGAKTFQEMPAQDQGAAASTTQRQS